MIEIFSYWIFVWFILYIIGLIKYNPLIFLILGIIATTFQTIYLFIKKTSKYNLQKFIIINIILKCIPILIIILNYSIVFKLSDFIFGIYILISYLIIIFLLKKNPIKDYNNIMNTYITDDDKYKTSFSRSYDYIYKKLIL